MEMGTIAQRIALAESRVLQCDVWVSRQRTLVRHLERHGLDTSHARKLLKELEIAQVGAVEDRNQLEVEMSLLATGPAGSRSGEKVPVSPTTGVPSSNGQETTTPRQA